MLAYHPMLKAVDSPKNDTLNLIEPIDNVLSLRLFKGVVLLGGGFYTLWLWLQDQEPLMPLVAPALLGGGTVALYFAWVWKRDENGSESIARPRTDDPAKGLEGAGWKTRQ